MWMRNKYVHDYQGQALPSITQQVDWPPTSSEKVTRKDVQRSAVDSAYSSLFRPRPFDDTRFLTGERHDNPRQHWNNAGKGEYTVHNTPLQLVIVFHEAEKRSH